MKSVITEDELTGLIQENRREMYYFAMSMIANPTEAQDVVGEAIMRAFEHDINCERRILPKRG